MEYINKLVSNNLKTLRTNKKLSLKKLSQMTGINRDLLSNIENEKSNTTIVVLWKISEALEVPLTALIEEKSPVYNHVKCDDYKNLASSSGYTIESIFPFNKNIEILHLNIDINSKIENRGHNKELTEFLYLITGKIKILIGDTPTLLNPGDSFKFRGEFSHKIINIGNENAKMLNILKYD